MKEVIDIVGFLGGGQLGRLSTVSLKNMGYGAAVLDPIPNCPASQVGAEQIQAPLDDEDAIRELARRSGVITWEVESFPAETLLRLKREEGLNVQPDPERLITIQDKLEQHKWLRDIVGVGVAPFSTLEDAAVLGSGPFVVKDRRGGFDGRGNRRVADLQSLAALDVDPSKVYVERRLNFRKELAVIAARDIRGDVETYPVVETVHRNDICHMVTSPAQVDPAIHRTALDIAHTALGHIEGAGVFAIEMFVDHNDSVLVNEIALRVHNSGHHTLNSCETSQFTQHGLAVTGMRLGSARQWAPAAVMMNILGSETRQLDRSGITDIPRGSKVYFYGKTEERKGRKVGHVTAVGDTVEDAKRLVVAARAAIRI